MRAWQSLHNKELAPTAPLSIDDKVQLLHAEPQPRTATRASGAALCFQAEHCRLSNLAWVIPRVCSQKRPLTLHGVLADPSDSQCLRRLQLRSTTRTRKLNVQPLPGHPLSTSPGDGGRSSEQRAALQRSAPRYGFSALRLHQHQTRCQPQVLLRSPATCRLPLWPPHPLPILTCFEPIPELLGAVMQGTRSGGLCPWRGGLSCACLPPSLPCRSRWHGRRPPSRRLRTGTKQLRRRRSSRSQRAPCFVTRMSCRCRAKKAVGTVVYAAPSPSMVLHNGWQN